ncbi:LUD domain-containing protein [Miltoncostaea marina]|uniref:LUD domain-containing protein n=1 Tax=Miltoncostaea marina TaxID=2843215 RepID=UPI001C3D82EE|nr:lactate utilization protein B [Miltoncostaea marina]
MSDGPARGRPHVAYPEASEPLRERTRAALADDELGGNLRTAAASWAAGRARIGAEQPFAEMRLRTREIRRRSVRNLPALLDRLEERVAAAGGTVARVADAEAACRYITDLAAARGATVLAKSKSMATEEIKLNEALEQAGLRVVETDLGEWILQLAGEHPSHIIAPAVHLNTTQVRELFMQESGQELPADREALVAHARVRLREVFAAADIGISGVNLAVAETGTVCVVENEGNGRLVTGLPRIHVAVMGMERVVETWDEAAHILQILPMAAIGDTASTYLNLITGPRADDEADGPEELHLLILDDGRSALRGTQFEEILDCIRCGACLYSCPMWRSVGGQAYGSPYSGPIGAVLTPLLEGVKGRRSSELPFLSSLCGACHEACPAGIPLHDLLVKVRSAVTTPEHRRDRMLFRLWSATWRHPVAYGLQRRAARLALRLVGRRGWARRLPGPGAPWTDQRDLPTQWPPR